MAISPLSLADFPKVWSLVWTKLYSRMGFTLMLAELWPPPNTHTTNVTLTRTVFPSHAHMLYVLVKLLTSCFAKLFLWCQEVCHLYWVCVSENRVALWNSWGTYRSRSDVVFVQDSAMFWTSLSRTWDVVRFSRGMFWTLYTVACMVVN